MDVFEMIKKGKKLYIGGDVRNRTGVQNQATLNVYMLREVV